MNRHFNDLSLKSEPFVHLSIHVTWHITRGADGVYLKVPVPPDMEEKVDDVIRGICEVMKIDRSRLDDVE